MCKSVVDTGRGSVVRALCRCMWSWDSLYVAVVEVAQRQTERQTALPLCLSLSALRLALSPKPHSHTSLAPTVSIPCHSFAPIPLILTFNFFPFQQAKSLSKVGCNRPFLVPCSFSPRRRRFTPISDSICSTSTSCDNIPS